MTNKFKKGDRVRRINHDNNDVVRVGTEWTVASTETVHGYNWVKLEETDAGGGSEDNYVLVASAKPYTFKAGDRVRRTGPDHRGVKNGCEYVVSGEYSGFMQLKGSAHWYDPECFELVVPLTEAASVDPEEMPAESLVKATFALSRKEIEKVLKSHLESKLGITTGDCGIARLGEHEVTLEAEVISA
ncbi:hypothetical protein [Brucella sp. 10RB9210]|uniref:hypothetical protein n=1 Tax=Brucella sp. 10RB9210 TaxID=1844037 RepID=UPI0012AD7802|nr:hypothetical protein [Brucella sp. 10RB9210]MRN79476.1 hypothetical protein [Brucella sp. 10RB9210]